METEESGEIKEEKKVFISTYTEYAKILRYWLVAYGVGGPVLFLTQTEISNKIIESGQARTIVYLFLFGVLLQVFIALLNKWVNWVLYAYTDPKDRKNMLIKSMIYNVSNRISEQFWIDILCDIGSILLLGTATGRVLLIFTTGSA